MIYLRRSWIVILMLVVAGVFLVLLGCEPSAAGEPVSKATQTIRDGESAVVASSAPMTYTLNLLHTNDTWGYVDPCG